MHAINCAIVEYDFLKFEYENVGSFPQKISFVVSKALQLWRVSFGVHFWCRVPSIKRIVNRQSVTIPDSDEMFVTSFFIH